MHSSSPRVAIADDLSEVRRRPSILLLTTQFYSTHGGIPAYMQRLVDVFQSGTEDGSKCVCVAFAGEDAGAEMESHKTDAFRFQAFRGKLSFLAGAVRIGIETRPDITVAGHLGLAPVAMIIRFLNATRRYGIVLHGIEAWVRTGWLDRWAAHQADFVVATTRYTASTFSALNGAEPDRLHVLPLALSEEDTPERPVTEPVQCTRVLTVGRLAASERYKGIDTLILAVAQLLAEGYSLVLDVVGAGDDLDRLKQMAADQGVAHHVRFHGRVSDEALQQFYCGCDIFGMPSKGEGFGIVFLEAMRHGKPCIGGNHGGTPEVVTDGVTGYLVEHGNREELVRSLKTLIQNPELRHKMGRRAQDTVRDRYLFSSFRSNWLRLLDAFTPPEFASSREAVRVQRT